MTDPRTAAETDVERRRVMQGAGLFVAGGLLASTISPTSIAADTRPPAPLATADHSAHGCKVSSTLG